MTRYEYLNVPLRVWEVDYNKLGSEGWLLVMLYYDRAWLVREVEPEITTKDLLRGAYEGPTEEEIEESLIDGASPYGSPSYPNTKDLLRGAYKESHAG